MPVNETQICNLALQKLGAARIVSMSEDSKNARAVSAAYEPVRDLVLSSQKWRFAFARAVLANDPTAPLFDYGYAYRKPTDFLALVFSNDDATDWSLEGEFILSNFGPPLNLPYIQRVIDTSKFPPTFSEAVACKLAWQLCEELTQSNTKKADAKAEFEDAIKEARRVNAIQSLAQDAPTDGWVAARLVSGTDPNWLH